MHQLFAFVRADLDAHRARAPAPAFDGPPTGFEDAGGPAFPKSLFLLRPLFAARELGPVAPAAQASVPVPAGLDLDAWFVPPAPDAEDDGRARKARKGKEREGAPSGAKTKDGKRKKRREAEVEEEEAADEPDEAPEDAAEREKVHPSPHLPCGRSFFCSEKRSASSASATTRSTSPTGRQARGRRMGTPPPTSTRSRSCGSRTCPLPR
jgi:hypothetical protein